MELDLLVDLADDDPPGSLEVQTVSSPRPSVSRSVAASRLAAPRRDPERGGAERELTRPPFEPLKRDHFSGLWPVLRL